MRPEELAVLQQQMLAEISADTFQARDFVGKPSLDDRVMAAMAGVPRHEFVPVELRPLAYANVPLPIGFEKTISQPFIVALMTDLLDVAPADTVLEVGTGLGYQAAVLAHLARKVYSMEIRGVQNVEIRIGNGYHGWSEHAPFDKIMVTAAPDLIPPPLIHQLKNGGKMVLPAGLPDAQQLMLVEKDDKGKVRTKEILRVRFSQLEEAPDN
jgi:protein-L-isoaspartate(D-aspartate) O-methyltransferase